MNNFGSSDPLDYNFIFSEIIKREVKRDFNLVYTVMVLKNLGYSKKRIQSEIRKYKKRRRKLLQDLNS